MKNFKQLVILSSTYMLIVSLPSGCAETSFKSSATRPQPKKEAAEVTEAVAEAPVDAGDGSARITACTKSTTPVIFNLSVPRHRDGGKGGSLPQAEVMESNVARFDMSSMEGSVLPVSKFGLDDIAFLVKETDTIAAIASGRNITIPPYALLLYDGNNSNYAAGSVDSKLDTTYNFTGKPSVRIPGGSDMSLQAVYNLGVPLIAHNKIKLDDLKAKGFVDSAGKIAFKLMHVAHGSGNVDLQLTLNPCQ